MHKRVLLVDDSATIHKIVDLTIDRQSFDLSAAYTADEAVKLTSEGFSIILIDSKIYLSAPKNFLDSLKQACPNCGIVLLVGTYDQHFDEESKSPLIDDYLVKPFNSGTLNMALKEILAKKEAGYNPYTPQNLSADDVAEPMDREEGEADSIETPEGDPFAVEPLGENDLIDEQNKTVIKNFATADLITDEIPEPSLLTESSATELHDHDDTEQLPEMLWQSVEEDATEEDSVEEESGQGDRAEAVDASKEETDDPVIYSVLPIEASQSDPEPMTETVTESGPESFDLTELPSSEYHVHEDTEHLPEMLWQVFEEDAPAEEPAAEFQSVEQQAEPVDPQLISKTIDTSAEITEEPTRMEEDEETDELFDFLNVTFSGEENEAPPLEMNIAVEEINEPFEDISTAEDAPLAESAQAAEMTKQPETEISVEEIIAPDEYDFTPASGIFKDIETVLGPTEEEEPPSEPFLTPLSDEELSGLTAEDLINVSGSVTEEPDAAPIIDTFDMELPFSETGSFHTVSEYEKAFYGDDAMNDRIAEELENGMSASLSEVSERLFSAFDSEDTLLQDFTSEKDAFITDTSFTERVIPENAAIEEAEDLSDPYHNEIIERQELMSLFDELHMSFDSAFGNMESAKPEQPAFDRPPVEDTPPSAVPVPPCNQSVPVNEMYDSSDLAAKLTVELSRQDLVTLLEQTVNKEILEKIIRDVLQDSIGETVEKLVPKLAEKMVREELRLIKGEK